MKTQEMDYACGAIREARLLLANGHPEQAYELMRNGHSVVWTPEALAFFDELRGSVLSRLRERVVAKGVVFGQVDPAPNIRAFPLKSRDAFIFGLLRATLAIHDVVALSPLDEIDTLRSVSDLVEFGLLTPIAEPVANGNTYPKFRLQEP